MSRGLSTTSLEDRRGDVGVDDVAAAKPVRWEAWRSAREASYSSSDSQRSGWASSSTDVTGLTP